VSTSDVNFHVRHEVFPNRVLAIMRAISKNEPFEDITQYDRQIKRMRSLGLLDDEGKLTELAESILRVIERRETLWGDLGHFLHYTLWDESTPYLNGFSWFYREICNYVFEQEEFKFGNRKLNDALCLSFNSQIEASEIFQPYLKENPSLSADSISGIQHWLEALEPPVIEKHTFTRRAFCSPELMLLAIGWVFRHEPDPVGVPLLLNRPQREAICRLCLLDTKFFDRTLDWMLPRFSKVIRSEDKSGFYGRSIRLHKLPTLEDIP
jgi:hypothetical protein